MITRGDDMGTADSHADSHDPSEQARLFHEGLRLFNAGEWFEAHEAWEALWHTLSGERRQFVQGLIQCAVVLEHVRRGNPRGALTMLERARPRFTDLPDVYMGVEADTLLRQLDTFVQPLRAMPADAFEPRAGRNLTLPVDLRDAPTIALHHDPFSAHQ